MAKNNINKYVIDVFVSRAHSPESFGNALIQCGSESSEAGCVIESAAFCSSYNAGTTSCNMCALSEAKITHERSPCFLIFWSLLATNIISLMDRSDVSKEASLRERDEDDELQHLKKRKTHPFRVFEDIREAYKFFMSKAPGSRRLTTTTANFKTAQDPIESVLSWVEV